MGSILDSARAQVDAALAKVPPDKTKVWITTIDFDGTIRSGAAIRKEAWTYGAEAAWNFHTKEGSGFAYIKVEL